MAAPLDQAGRARQRLRNDGLTTDERKELVRLRRENRDLGNVDGLKIEQVEAGLRLALGL